MNFLLRLRRWFCDHDYQNVGNPYLIGYTTAPYPAIDEYEQLRVCNKCGNESIRFRSFVMDGFQQENVNDAG